MQFVLVSNSMTGYGTMTGHGTMTGYGISLASITFMTSNLGIFQDGLDGRGKTEITDPESTFIAVAPPLGPSDTVRKGRTGIPLDHPSSMLPVLTQRQLEMPDRGYGNEQMMLFDQ